MMRIQWTEDHDQGCGRTITDRGALSEVHLDPGCEACRHIMAGIGRYPDPAGIGGWSRSPYDRRTP